MTAGKFADFYSRKGVVYFLGVGRPHPVAIKIGITQKTKVAFKNRLHGIQGDNHMPVDVLGVIVFDEGPTPMKAAERREQDLHKQFKHLRIFEDNTPGHEWFTAAPDLLDYIAPYKALPEGWPRSLAKIATSALTHP
ncbi:MAG TPA: GIY-YIG nuclease family protein [Rhizomicrobium sp.]|jgi:hypothetical protein|nr:GIY-YIG nuclease family protein [Rhizomicrobium sp.]